MVAPSAKLVVPAGANHTVLVASPLLLIVSVAVPFGAAQLAGNTKSWMDTTLLGMMLRYLSSIPDFTANPYYVTGHTASATTTGVSMVLAGGFLPILLTVA
jgi:hypothetical protein